MKSKRYPDGYNSHHNKIEEIMAETGELHELKMLVKDQADELKDLKRINYSLKEALAKYGIQPPPDAEEYSNEINKMRHAMIMNLRCDSVADRINNAKIFLE